MICWEKEVEVPEGGRVAPPGGYVCLFSAAQLVISALEERTEVRPLRRVRCLCLRELGHSQS